MVGERLGQPGAVADDADVAAHRGAERADRLVVLIRRRRRVALGEPDQRVICGPASRPWMSSATRAA